MRLPVAVQCPGLSLSTFAVCRRKLRPYSGEQNMANHDGIARWDFHCDDELRWTWTRKGHAGALRSSVANQNLGAAMCNAMSHGFRPQEDRFLVDLGVIVTRYEPGEKPQMLRP